MLKKVELVDLRRIQLEILDDVDRFCREKGLHYSLGGGTLLGAVRHKGYIPWDDDIDINMPRADYEIFAREFSSAQNEVIDLRYHPSCREICIKVVRKNTRMIDIQLGRCLWGICIDVFPIDGCPENASSLCLQIGKIRDQIATVCPYFKTVSKSHRIEWFFRFCLKRLCHPFTPSVLTLKRRLHEIASVNPLENSSKAGGILGGYGSREVMDKEVFDDYVMLDFEGKKYPAFAGYDVYLKSLYGNYMELPPPECRVSVHLYDSYIDA